MNVNKKISKQCYLEFKKQAVEIKTKEDLIKLEDQYKRYSECFGSYQPTIEAFFASKYHEYRQRKLNALIKPFVSWEPLKYNLQYEEEAEKKIKAIRKPYLKFRFEGLFNLLTDKRNLIYNPLYIRQSILDDLKTFKSLNQFKISNVSTDRLKKEYSFLAVKGNSDKFHTKVYFIEHGFYVLKTIGNDGVFLKAIYIQYKVNKLFKRGKMNIPFLGEDKFNLHPIDAWKFLNKDDNIKYYRYCNNMGFDKKNRQLLKSIRAKQGGETFSSRLERIKDVLDELEAQYDDLSKTTYNGVVLTNYEYLDELDQIRREYWSLTEEHNSDDVPTYLEDY